jgi:hypothetical protein
MADPKPHTVFMLLKATPVWLGLAPPERFAFVGGTLRPLIARYPAVRMRYFDAEAYSARVSDVAVWESADLKAWRGLVEELRETPFWDVYFQVVEIIPAMEDDYADFYGALATA